MTTLQFVEKFFPKVISNIVCDYLDMCDICLVDQSFYSSHISSFICLFCHSQFSSDFHSHDPICPHCKQNDTPTQYVCFEKIKKYCVNCYIEQLSCFNCNNSNYRNNRSFMYFCRDKNQFYCGDCLLIDTVINIGNYFDCHSLSSFTFSFGDHVSKNFRIFPFDILVRKNSVYLCRIISSAPGYFHGNALTYFKSHDDFQQKSYLFYKVI